MYKRQPYETYDCLRELLHVDKWRKADQENGKGEVDMCKALEEIAEMAKQEGVQQGILLAKKVIRYAQEGRSAEEIAGICGIPVDEVREITE